MEEYRPKFVVGIDIGTENIHGVMATVEEDGLSVVAAAEVKSSGVRKGEVVSLNSVAGAIDETILEMEKTSGIHGVSSAVVSINGVHLQSTKVEGMIATENKIHQINQSDLAKIESAAMSGQELSNREILNIIPFEYRIDGQGGIRNPLGMNGQRIEIYANVISAMYSNVADVKQVMNDILKVQAQKIMPAIVAASEAVLLERQRENGVIMIDFGAKTTGVAVYDEGLLQTLFVLPVGSDNLTQDLARILAIDMDTAEEVKRRFVNGLFDQKNEEVSLGGGSEKLIFSQTTINDNARERLSEIFNQVRKGLELSGYGFGMPDGAILVGGGAKMRGIEVFAKEILGMSVKIGIPTGLLGQVKRIEKPEYATAVGLMLSASEDFGSDLSGDGQKQKGKGIFGRLFG